LFLAQTDMAQRQFQYFSKKLELSDEMLSRFRSNINLNNRYCEVRNIPYLHIVFPAKIPCFQDLFELNGIPISPIFSEGHALPNVYYPIDILNGKEHFYKYDTHNNDLGKLLLGHYLIERLQLNEPFLKPLFKEVKYKGDLNSRIGLQPVNEKKFVGFENISKTILSFSNSNALPGNTGRIIFIYNAKPILHARLLICGDSFIQGIAPILAHYFAEIVFFRNPYILDDIADNLEPDYIITSNAERYLVSVPDAKIKRPFFMNFFNTQFKPENFSENELSAFDALFSGKSSLTYKRWQRRVHEKFVT
jgi:hypothetical protein